MISSKLPFKSCPYCVWNIIRSFHRIRGDGVVHMFTSREHLAPKTFAELTFYYLKNSCLGLSGGWVCRADFCLTWQNMVRSTASAFNPLFTHICNLFSSFSIHCELICKMSLASLIISCLSPSLAIKRLSWGFSGVWGAYSYLTCSFYTLPGKDKAGLLCSEPAVPTTCLCHTTYVN